MLILGDCLDILPTLDECSIDSCVTDPPYGLKFMAKGWDHGVPGEAYWREVLRVLKPGAYLLAFGGTRTNHRLVCAIEDSGFEIRDCIMWLYGSGFPKSHNLKGTGLGTALKPAYEPIIMARKPLIGTVAKNVERYGTGALNIDRSRVATTDSLNGGAYAKAGNVRHDGTENWRYKRDGGAGEYQQPIGRWPANVVHDGSDEVLERFPDVGGGNDKGSYSYAGKEYDNKANSMFNGDKPQAPSNYNDRGSAARFFYCAKASKKEREMGLDRPLENVNDGRKTSIDNPYQRGDTLRKNIHPTVKPIVLMEWLVNMVTPPGGTVLDPFMGSGTTGMVPGFNFIGIEKEQNYFDIASQRLDKPIGYMLHMMIDSTKEA